MSNIAIQGAATGTGVFTLASPATNTDRTLVLPDEAGTLVTTASLPNPLTSGTSVASTSGTAIDFTGIPSWAKRITVMFDLVSTNGGSVLLVQLGTSGGIDSTTTYAGSSFYIQGGGGGQYMSAYGGFNFYGSGGAANTNTGSLVLTQISTNKWVVNGYVAGSASFVNVYMAGVKTTSAALDRVRVTTVNGTDTFDAGSINIMYE